MPEPTTPEPTIEDYFLEDRTFPPSADFRAGALPLFEQQRLAPVIHQVLPLSEAAQAHRLLLDRAQFGKLVLRP